MRALYFDEMGIEYIEPIEYFLICVHMYHYYATNIVIGLHLTLNITKHSFNSLPISATFANSRCSRFHHATHSTSNFVRFSIF